MANDEALMALARKRAQDKIGLYSLHRLCCNKCVPHRHLVVCGRRVSVVSLPAWVLGNQYRRTLFRGVSRNRHERQDDAARVREAQTREVEGFP